MLFLVYGQRPLTDESVATHTAHVRPLPCVVPHVHREWRLLREALATLVALVRSVPSMGPHVQFQCSPQSKAPATFLALDRFEALVDEEVVAQAPFGIHLLAAVIAHEPLSPVLVDSQEVMLQISFLQKRLVAQLTSDVLVGLVVFRVAGHVAL